MTNRLSSADERLLQRVVKEATSLIMEGEEPDTAMAKVAKAQQLRPGYLKIAINALNNGLQLAHWAEKTAIEERLEPVPLVDFAKVASQIWTTDEKQAEDLGTADWYQELQQRERLQELRTISSDLIDKTASCEETTVPAVPATEDVHVKLASLSRQRYATRAAQDKLAAETADILREVQQQRHGLLMSLYADPSPQGFSNLKLAATAYCSAAEQAVLSWVEQQLPACMTKSAAASGLKMARDSESLQRLRDVATIAKKAARLCRDFRKAAADCLTTEVDYLRVVYGEPASTHCDLMQPIKEKVAGVMAGAVIGAGTAQTTRQLLDMALGGARDRYRDEVEKRTQKALDQLEDVPHEQQLQAIRTQAMLHRLLTDPDSAVSGYPPERVLQAYNDVSQMLPSAIQQPASLETVLSRRLGGPMESFEANELAKLDQAMGANRAKHRSESSLSSKPELVRGPAIHF